MPYMITSTAGAEYFIAEDSLPDEREFELSGPPPWLLKKHGLKAEGTDSENATATEKATASWNAKRRETHEAQRLGEAFSVFCDGRKEWPSRRLYSVELVSAAAAPAVAVATKGRGSRKAKRDPVIVEV